MPPAIPLTNWAQGRLDSLAEMAGVPMPDAASLLGERAAIHGFRVPGRVSCHGGCRFYRARDGWVALNLARQADRELLPALFHTDAPVDIDTEFAALDEAEAVQRGRTLGMAIAGLGERATSPAIRIAAQGYSGDQSARPPRVLDLSALWAGPLATRLLGIASCDVTRIESVGREDPLRHSDPAHFASLSATKAGRTLDIRTSEGREELLRMIADSDIVIEAARPRALRQLGIDADVLVRSQRGLTWLTITGHGDGGDAGNWVGFGDDTSVAGGLSAALHDATGQIGFVGDAIADPLTGIVAAETAFRHYCQGRSARLILSMSGIIGQAISEDAGIAGDLAHWAGRVGEPMLTQEPVTC